VLVVGGGGVSVALYAVAAARALGASEVMYIDGDRARCAIAEQLGAHVIDSARYAELKPGRFPIVADASADPEGLRLCLRSTEVEGTCASAGLYTEPVALPLWEMYVRGARFLTGRAHARALLPLVLPRIQDGSLRIEAIEPRRVAWQDADRAWLEPSLKLIVER
jgi:alcohol dehydrogenase